MKVDLDPAILKMFMEMWRKAVDMEIPLAPDIRIHFFAKRGQLLDDFSKIAKNWLILLGHCKATGEDLIQLDELEAEIKSFQDWAEAGISELAKLAVEVSELDKPKRTS
jgi:hypothetical protein